MTAPSLNGLDRSAVRAAYRADEEACVAERLAQAVMTPAELAETQSLARRLVEGVRGRGQGNAVDSLLHSFALSTDEGIALMCLAEALLRIPDAATRDRLIADKIGGKEWSAQLGKTQSLFVNASTFGLMLTGGVVAPAQGDDWAAVARRAVTRLGMPVIRRAILEGMRILGHHFVFGRTINEALKRADGARETHSFDMLGEAARTAKDADFYFDAYARAIAAVGKARGAGPIERTDGVSVKLSALHPRYEWSQATRVHVEMLPRLKQLVAAAAAADICLAIDAEEADRLELSMNLIEALMADDALFARADGNQWQGLGIVIQAYQKRALPLVHWVAGLARRYNRRIMVRLVKGAYWDAEIKATQVGGYPDYPVFTRKTSTDVSYIACARALFDANDVIFAGFATHNAATIAAIKAMAAGRAFEFQRLHGMGEELYDELAAVEGDGAAASPVRIYAPVGGHKELLAYLVRRLLENGANASFVNRLADADQPVDAIIADPIAATAALTERRNPRIPLPADLFAPERGNSAGIDLSDPLVREPLLARLTTLEAEAHGAGPIIGGKGAPGQSEPVTSPFDRTITVGTVANASATQVDEAMRIAHDAQPGWDALGANARAAMLEDAADLFEADREVLLSLCVREAGKTLPDAVLELREAIDFLRYYAAQARTALAPAAMPGPTGEANTLSLHGRGVFAAISPWNFPLAIFTGQVAAALVTGNAVLAKPAPQTPLIAARAVALLHRAGVPADVLHLLPGGGDVGAAMVAHPMVAGVVFTGSTGTARGIARTLAGRDGPIVPLIAETGGQNAMIVDSSALPEQVTRDVVASAFQSAGQRCSALRMLYLQDDIADDVIAMIGGAMAELRLGDPRDLATDIGPVIDAAAKARLDAHARALAGDRLYGLLAPQTGDFVPPTAFAVPGIAALEMEHFGPLLHIARFGADEIDQVVDAINATGYGLTLGIHSRIDATIDRIVARARVGNIYVNRNQIGAVVGSQPFGGEGLSGTGPKAGGPHYLHRFVTERTLCVDTTAAGGNATLMAS